MIGLAVLILLSIEEKVHRIIEAKGVRIVRNAELLQILEDEENHIEFALFKFVFV